MTRQFTGWHMATILIAFFGIVIGVNLVMARAAISTFGGTVVDNSYVASQKFNGWLRAADRQAQDGWRGRIGLDRDRHVIVAVEQEGRAVPGATVSGVATHPLGRAAPFPLVFEHGEDGTLRALPALPEGRWIVALTVAGNGAEARFRDVVQ